MINLLKIKKLFVIFAFLFSLAACDELKDSITVTIPVTDKEVIFDVGSDPSTSPVAKVSSLTNETKVLLDKTFDVNVAEEAKKKGYDMDKIIEFVITVASVQLVEPTNFDMGVFNTLKLYFDDTSKLVASVDKEVEKGKLTLKIVNGDLLKQLKQDQLHVIITGDQLPAQKVKLKLKTSYKAKVKVFK